MQKSPKQLAFVLDAIRKAGYDPAAAFSALALALAHPALKSQSNADGGIDCALCANEAWWQSQFGSGWELVRWWYCGPLGLDCGQGS